MGSCLSIDDQVSLIKPFSNKEIKDAMFSIGNNKSPGIDGFNSGFFKHSWELVQSDVCVAIREFCTSCKLLNNIASALLVLIPKTVNPSNAKDYRPIACCSALYKCISMLICTRLGFVLP